MKWYYKHINRFPNDPVGSICSSNRKLNHLRTHQSINKVKKITCHSISFSSSSGLGTFSKHNNSKTAPQSDPLQDHISESLEKYYEYLKSNQNSS